MLASPCGRGGRAQRGRREQTTTIQKDCKPLSAVTALPKGEPRLSRNIRCVLHLSCLLTADNSTLTPRKVFSLTHMSRQKSNHTAFFDMPERRRFTSEAAAFLYVSVSLFQTALDVRQVFLAAPGVIGVRVDVYILRFQL